MRTWTFVLSHPISSSAMKLFISSTTSSTLFWGNTAQLSKSTLSILHILMHALGSSASDSCGFDKINAISIVIFDRDIVPVVKPTRKFQVLTKETSNQVIGEDTSATATSFYQ
ncbi:hypothetical protein HJC23_013069 [Cyclotella cryptica]|uniref:Uncharacterized protein n=1 Tax=Cyclotella cryptica TaxID=29204 RepID=A0ABD3Q7K0_9STRA